MTRTGYDKRVDSYMRAETVEALDELIPDELSRSEFLRTKTHEIIEEGAVEIPDDKLRDARRVWKEEDGDSNVRRSFFRKRVRNLAKEHQGDGSTVEEIRDALRPKQEAARHLPEHLHPEETVEYIDCLMVLVRAYDYDEMREYDDLGFVDGEDSHEDPQAKISYKEAVEHVHRTFPEAHKDKTAELIDRIDLPRSEVVKLDDATENGVLDGFVDEGILTVSFDGSDSDNCPECGDGVLRPSDTSIASHQCTACREFFNVERDEDEEVDEGNVDEGNEEQDRRVLYSDGGIPECPDCDGATLYKVSPQLNITEGADYRCSNCQQLFVVRERDKEDENREEIGSGLNQDVDVSPNEDCEDCTELVACHSCAQRQRTGEPMTDGGTQRRRASSTPSSSSEDDKTTVRARLDDVLDGEIHAMQTTHRFDGAIYLSVLRSCAWGDISESGRDVPVLDLRTVVVDLLDDGGVEDVRVSDNGIWVRQDRGVASNMAQMFARAASALDGMQTDDALVLDGSDDVDAEMLLDAEMTVPDPSTEGQATHKMESHPGIDPSRPWGYGGDAPPEAFDLARKMRDAGLEPSDHLIRLWWGQKKPHSDERKGIRPDDELRPVAELKGNYGVEVRQRDAGLVVVDVDDPDAFGDLDVDLPDSFSVSSPHGDDDRRHIYLTCSEKDIVREELGGWSAYQSWGELYVGNPFVVGPGSQLSAYGCDNGPHERGDPDACDACASEDGGYYDVVRDAPIREVDADTLVSLVETDSDDEDGPVDEPRDDAETCDSCGSAYPEEDADEYLIEAGPVRVCRGGCE
jgi:hypothetical protein